MGKFTKRSRRGEGAASQWRRALRDALPGFQESLKTGIAAKRVEVRILFGPNLVQGAGRTLRHDFFEAGDGFFVESQEGVAAGHIVENHGIIGIDRKGAASPFEGAFPLPGLEQSSGTQVESASIVGM